jgi:hypothetical protein
MIEVGKVLLKQEMFAHWLPKFGNTWAYGAHVPQG